MWLFFLSLYLPLLFSPPGASQVLPDPEYIDTAALGSSLCPITDGHNPPSLHARYEELPSLWGCMQPATSDHSRDGTPEVHVIGLLHNYPHGSTVDVHLTRQLSNQNANPVRLVFFGAPRSKLTLKVDYHGLDFKKHPLTVMVRNTAAKSFVELFLLSSYV